jgi:hypothetical protein
MLGVGLWIADVIYDVYHGAKILEKNGMLYDLNMANN